MATSDVKIACVTKAIATTDEASDIDVTLPSGFGTPKAALIFGSYATADSTDADGALAIGFVINDGNEYCNVITAESGNSTSVVSLIHREASVVLIIPIEGTTTGYIRLDPPSGAMFGTDKLTFNVQQCDGDFQIHVVAFGGDDCKVKGLVGVLPGATLPPTADTRTFTHNLNTDQSVGTNYLIFGLADDQATGNSQSITRAHLSFTAGVVTGGGTGLTHMCTGFSMKDGASAPSGKSAYGLLTEADGDGLFVSVPHPGASTWKDNEYKIDSATNDTFVLSRHDGADAACGVRWMIIDIGDLSADVLKMDSLETSASTYEVTGSGFEPQFCLNLMGKANSYSTNYVSSGNANTFSFGMASGDAVTGGRMDTTSVADYAICFAHDDGATTDESESSSQAAVVWGRDINSGVNSTLWHAGPPSFTSDGWEIATGDITTVNSGVTDKWLSLVVERPAAAGRIMSSIAGVGGGLAGPGGLAGQRGGLAG